MSPLSCSCLPLNPRTDSPKSSSSPGEGIAGGSPNAGSGVMPKGMGVGAPPNGGPPCCSPLKPGPPGVGAGEKGTPYPGIGVCGGAPLGNGAAPGPPGICPTDLAAGSCGCWRHRAPPRSIMEWQSASRQGAERPLEMHGAGFTARREQVVVESVRFVHSMRRRWRRWRRPRRRWRRG